MKGSVTSSRLFFLFSFANRLIKSYFPQNPKVCDSLTVESYVMPLEVSVKTTHEERNNQL